MLPESSAANRACELFKSRGVTTMANDYIVDVALTMTAVIAMYCTILTFHLVVPMEAGKCCSDDRADVLLFSSQTRELEGGGGEWWSFCRPSRMSLSHPLLAVMLLLSSSSCL